MWFELYNLLEYLQILSAPQGRYIHLNQVLAVEYKTYSYYFELSSACDKSSIISSMSSMPIDSLTSSAGEPADIN